MERVHVLFGYFHVDGSRVGRGARGEGLGAAAAGYAPLVSFLLDTDRGSRFISTFFLPASGPPLHFSSLPFSLHLGAWGTSSPGLSCHSPCRVDLTLAGAWKRFRGGYGDGDAARTVSGLV